MNNPLGSHSTWIITQTFGDNPTGYTQFGLRGHNGIDYACALNTPVYTVDYGTVDKAGYDATGYGNYVKVKHTWGYTLYAHLGYTLVKVGQSVAAGDVIGRSGSTGNSTGPHLHFEVRPNGIPQSNGYNGAVDPQVYHLPDDVVITPPAKRIAYSGANLRTTPDIKSDKAGLLYEGAAVVVVNTSGDWCMVTATGYVHKDLIV